MVKKITKWFYLQPFLFRRESLHLLDISRNLKENHTTVRTYLNEFAKEGLLKITQKGRLTLYELNFDFPLIIDYLLIAEKEFLISCAKNKILKELIKDIQQKTTKPTIIFGSAATNFINAQDIDILTTEDLNTCELQKKYSKEIHLIKVDSLNEINNTLKKEIIKKHIIIFGGEEVIKWLI